MHACMLVGSPPLEQSGRRLVSCHRHPFCLLTVLGPIIMRLHCCPAASAAVICNGKDAAAAAHALSHYSSCVRAFPACLCTGCLWSPWARALCAAIGRRCSCGSRIGATSRTQQHRCAAGAGVGRRVSARVWRGRAGRESARGCSGGSGLARQQGRQGFRQQNVALMRWAKLHAERRKGTRACGLCKARARTPSLQGTACTDRRMQLSALVCTGAVQGGAAAVRPLLLPLPRGRERGRRV